MTAPTAADEKEARSLLAEADWAPTRMNTLCTEDAVRDIARALAARRVVPREKAEEAQRALCYMECDELGHVLNTPMAHCIYPNCGCRSEVWAGRERNVRAVLAACGIAVEE